MIIALLTDFGTRDYFVGAMKGVIATINKKAQIIDISHEIEPQDIAAASFTLRACYRDFPDQTIFVAVVDPGVGSERRAILVETANYFFIAPDNGILSFVFDETNDFRVFELTNKRYFRQVLSQTFHGRDIFSPCAAHLSNGVSPELFGSRLIDYVRLPDSLPQRVSKAEIEAQIIHIDRFGNLVTNLTKKDLPSSFFIEVNDFRIKKLQQNFSEANDKELFMIYGSAGFLEIAAFKDSAKNILNVEKSAKIKVFFEI